MNNVLLELVPLMIGAAVLPVWIIVVFLLLRGEGGLGRALAFAGGQVAVRLAQGIVFGYVFANYAQTHSEEGSAAIVNTLLLVVGIVLWITAIRKWRKEIDPNAEPPKWMSVFGSISAVKAFGLSVVLMLVSVKQWIFTLSALSLISEAEPGLQTGALVYFLFMLVAQSLIVLPIVIAAAAPHKSAQFLERGIRWLEKNNRTIVIAVSLVFGTYFIYQGIAGLMG